VTHLRKIMLEELQRRNYSAATIRSYIRTVEDFARHFDCQPDRLGPRQIREYQAELFQKRKLSPGTVTVSLAALRFFYTKTLRKAWSVSETPYPKKNDHLPTILSQEEVARLIDAADTHFHRTLLMTLYATGVRRAELTHLKVSDVDSQRMVIHVRGGKGRKDRLWAVAHNRSDVPRKVMCRESRSIHKKHRLLRVPLDSGCAGNCT
jgi:integrase/recombinase XerD